MAARDDFAIGIPPIAVRETVKSGQFRSIPTQIGTIGAQKICASADFLNNHPATSRPCRAPSPHFPQNWFVARAIAHLMLWHMPCFVLLFYAPRRRYDFSEFP